MEAPEGFNKELWATLDDGLRVEILRDFAPVTSTGAAVDLTDHPATTSPVIATKQKRMDSWTAIDLTVEQTNSPAMKKSKNTNEKKTRPSYQPRLYFHGTDEWMGKDKHLEELWSDQDFPPHAFSIDGIGRKAKIPEKTEEEEDEENKTGDEDRNKKKKKVVQKCRCGLAIQIKQVFKDGPNRGRFFKTCGHDLSLQGQGCKFFEWVGDHETDHRRENVKELTWLRFSDKHGYKMCQLHSVFRARSILQGSLGDCWFLSACAVLSQRDDLIKNIVLTHPKIPANGRLDFRLFLDGHWRRVSVDNYLPVRKRSLGVRGACVLRSAAVTSRSHGDSGSSLQRRKHCLTRRSLAKHHRNQQHNNERQHQLSGEAQ